MNNEKIKAILSDTEFLRTLLNLSSADEVKAALAEKGIEIDDEKALAIFAFANKAKSGELSENMLKNVAGGSWGSFWRFLCDTVGSIGV